MTADDLKDLAIAAQFDAAMASVHWLYANAPNAPTYATRAELLSAILPLVVDVPGDLAEFGVYTGSITQYVRPRFPQRRYFAFDSFRGVPDHMVLALAQHAYDRGGVIPDLPPDTIVHAGWFDETVPCWRASFDGTLAFVYVDCDLYASVRTVLDGITDRLAVGAVLAFDDWYNFPNWQAHSARAVAETTGLWLQPLGFCTKEHSGAFRVCGSGH